MKQRDRQKVIEWEEYRKNLMQETPVPRESQTEKFDRLRKLKTSFPDFCKYYFPNYTTAEFARFQLRFARKVINSDQIYIVRAWAREHAKSVIAGLFLPIFLMLTGRMKNMLLVSHSKDNADELLMPIMINLESNQRLLADFGNFKGLRNWEIGRFITVDGVSFRAIGAGQSPRGSRNEEKRPDLILIDDIDTDEESRNQTRIDNKWKWVEQALFPTMSISGKKRFIVVGNIIAKESCIVKAMRMADDYEKIDILDKNGVPAWKERYTVDQVNYMLSKISYASAQKEYFNNPITEGTVFPDMNWKPARPLQQYEMLVCYTDPSWKESSRNDYKATVLVGAWRGEFHVIKAFVEQTTTAKMIAWHYDIMNLVGDKNTVYYFMEANMMQDIMMQEFFDMGRILGRVIPLVGDSRKKPDKFTRIESLLEPLNRNGKLWLNEKERKSPHMQRLEEQFKAMAPGMRSHDDGPDAVEGAVYILNTKLREQMPIQVGRRRQHAKRY